MSAGRIAIGPRPRPGAHVRMIGPVRLVHTPWSALSGRRKARRVLGWTMQIGALGMVASAATANTDWNITQADVAEKFG